MAQILKNQFTRAVSKDNRVKELLKSIRKDAKSTVASDLVQEALREHKQKRTRKARPSRVLADSKNEVVKIETNNLQVRSRLAEIKTDLLERHRTLSQLIDATDAYVRNAHASALGKQATTEKAKDSLMYHTLMPAYILLGDYAKAEEIIDVLIADMDQGSYSLNRVVNALQIDARDRV